MLGFLRPHLRGSVWSLVLSCLAVAGTVAIPLLLGEAINAIQDGDRDMVLPLALAIVGAGVLRLGLAIPRRLISGRSRSASSTTCATACTATSSRSSWASSTASRPAS